MAKRLIDLSFPIHEGMKTYPASWHPKVRVRQMGRIPVEHRETRRVTLGTHTGTHVDAPLHFIPRGRTIDRLPLHLLIGPATVVNLAPCRPLQQITETDLSRALNGLRPERLILRTDWSKRWKKADYYERHPYLSQRAAAWIVGRGIKLLALDVPSPDHPAQGRFSANDSPNHKILLGNGIVLVEYLSNLAQVRRKRVELMVLPLKLKGCDGSPARCVVRE